MDVKRMVDTRTTETVTAGTGMADTVNERNHMPGAMLRDFPCDLSCDTHHISTFQMMKLGLQPWARGQTAGETPSSVSL